MFLENQRQNSSNSYTRARYYFPFEICVSS